MRSLWKEALASLAAGSTAIPLADNGKVYRTLADRIARARLGSSAADDAAIRDGTTGRSDDHDDTAEIDAGEVASP